MSRRRAISPIDKAALDTFSKVYRSLRRDGVAHDWAYRLALANAQRVRAGRCPLHPVRRWHDDGGDGVPVHSPLPPADPLNEIPTSPHQAEQQ